MCFLWRYNHHALPLDVEKCIALDSDLDLEFVFRSFVITPNIISSNIETYYTSTSRSIVMSAIDLLIYIIYKP